MSKAKKTRKPARERLVDPAPVDWSDFDADDDLAPTLNDRERLSDTERKARLRRSPELMRIRGLQSAAKFTPEERSARARRAALAGAAKRRAEREALGIPTVERDRVALSPSELSEWLEEFDAQNPDLVVTAEERRRGALILMKRHVAELALGKLS